MELDINHNYDEHYEYSDYSLEDHYVYYDEDQQSYSPAEMLQFRVDYYNFKDEWSNLFNNCMSAVFWQSLSGISTLLICCLAFRLTLIFTATLSINSRYSVHILHSFGACLGLLSLHSINHGDFTTTVIIILFYIFCTYFLFVIFTNMKLTCGRTVSIATVFYLIIGELLVQDPEHWHQIRGILLLLSMKSISCAFDLDAKRILTVPNILSYIAYCLHCGTLLFGPWVTFQDYQSSVTDPKRVSLNWVMSVIKGLASSMVCLLLSTCVFTYLFLDGTQPELPAITPFIANHWMLSYKTAISFHFSHFYVSYLAQTTCILSGIAAFDGDNSWSDFVVTKPLTVEFPTSMLNVVVAWNLPMSKWLKNYVYNSYRSLGKMTAVLLTYSASAILHGLSFHLAMSLLSLALYTSVEYSLRQKLSRIFNCEHIQARPKVTDSPSNPAPLWAHLFNFLWVLINLMHLSYLGAMFQSDDENLAREGYHMQHTIAKWRNLGFTSHIFAILCYALSCVLSLVHVNKD